MEIMLNGEPHQAPEGCSVLGLLESLSIDPSRVAVELNGVIIKKAHWAEQRLDTGAQVEVVQFVGGG
jgi:thiamine biosynthesis protein ThiS